MPDAEPTGENSYQVQGEVDFSTILPNPDCHVIGYAVQIKLLNEDGQLALVHGVSADITIWEALGMSTAAAQHYERRLTEWD